MVERRYGQRPLDRFIDYAVITGVCLAIGVTVAETVYHFTLGGRWSVIAENGRIIEYSGAHLVPGFLGARTTVTFIRQESLGEAYDMAQATILGPNHLFVRAANAPSFREIRSHIKAVCPGVQATEPVLKDRFFRATLVVDDASCIAIKPE